MCKPIADQSTRERILEVAGPLFAEKGFEGATVRDICEAADANIASVNYHYGGKSKLYMEVVARAIESRTKLIPMDGGLPGDAPPHQRLRAFVHAFLKRRFDRASPPWRGELLAREMRSATEIVRPMVRRNWRRNTQLLIRVVKDLLGRKAKPDDIDLCASSVIGQILFYFRSHDSRSSKSRSVPLNEKALEDLADHITEFSLGGIAGVRESTGSHAARSGRG
jgi:AcrR family transcriptional regulator